MNEYDEAVLNCFLEKQLQLFPEKIAESIDEAEAFLEECVAGVVDSVDLEEQNKEDILTAPEVFEVGDGRYLIVES